MGIYTRLDKWLLKFLDKIIAVSEPVREEILKSGILPEKVKFIQNGIDTSKYINRNSLNHIREEFQIPLNSKVVGIVGRLTSEKGHALLFEAARDLVKKHPDIYFLVVGDGPLLNDLKKSTETLPVIFAGFRKDMPDIYSAMDISILPSLNEGMPMVLLEAMASGKSVIATDVGDVGKVIEHRKNGILIQKKNANEISDALSYILTNEEEAKQMSIRAQKKIQDHYSSEGMAKKYIETYRKIQIIRNERKKR